MVLFGTFLYKVRRINSEAMLKLLAQRTSNITEIRLDRPPQKPLLTAFFDTNIIRKVEFTKCENFYDDTNTNYDDIEELIVGFGPRRPVVDFGEVGMKYT